jgi:RecA/RadA recombinase
MSSARDKKLRELRKKTGGESYETSTYGTITHYIDTGNMGINRAMTGSIYKGVPSGKVVQFAGESQTGKSLIAAGVVINAIKDGYERVFYMDSEGGMTRKFIEDAGTDLSKIDIVPCRDIEDCHVNMQNTFEFIEEDKKENPELRYLIVVDSLGALIPRKLKEDATKKNKMAGDMGLQAKLKNAMLKSWCVVAGITDTAVVVVNHVYDDPSAMYASKIKNIGGGKQTAYIPHITLQCSKRFEKSDDKDDEQAFQASILKFFTVKNRCCKSFYETEVYLDNKNGLQKWWALMAPAISMGFIIKHGSWYTVPSYDGEEKKMRMREILNKDEIWESFLDEFDKQSLELLSYSSPTIADEESMDAYIENMVTETEGQTIVSQTGDEEVD